MDVTPDTPVALLVSEPALTVNMNQAAVEVRAAMDRRGVRFAAVRQGGRVTAVLDRQVLNRRLSAAGYNLRVRDVVNPGMACLRPSASVLAATRLMQLTGSAAVPVVDERHRLVGLVTADRLAPGGDLAGARS